MGFLRRLFFGSEKKTEPAGDRAQSWTPKDWSIERIRKQGINPMVRNADEDYQVPAVNLTAGNRLARDCFAAGVPAAGK